MSVEEGALIVNSGGGGPPFPGTGAVELTNLKGDMVVVVMVVVVADTGDVGDFGSGGARRGMNVRRCRERG
jgi:hypothetical protein